MKRTEKYWKLTEELSARADLVVTPQGAYKRERKTTYGRSLCERCVNRRTFTTALDGERTWCGAGMPVYIDSSNPVLSCSSFYDVSYIPLATLLDMFDPSTLLGTGQVKPSRKESVGDYR